MKDKLLVHVCCAPDSVYFLRKLAEDFPDKEIVAYFYDPNIHPPEEYRLRLVETERVCRELGIELLEGPYEPESWIRKVRGLEREPEKGRRCEVCFDDRLKRSAEKAKELGASAFTTTLLMSPKKSREQLVRAGREAGRELGVEFLSPDYRKGGGVQESFRLSRQKNVYLQNYCGCLYGLINQKGDEARRKLTGWRGRPPGSAAETLFVKEVRLEAEKRGLPVKEFSFPFINWRVLEGLLECGGEVVPSEVLPYSPSLRGTVKTSLSRRRGKALYYDKQHLRILLGGELTAPFTPYALPTFLVEEKWEEVLTRERVKARLRTELFYDESSLLLVGSSDRVVGLPADTLPDGRGLSADKVLRLLEEKTDKIKRGELSLLLMGAQSLGKAGELFARRELGLNFIMVLEY